MTLIEDDLEPEISEVRWRHPVHQLIKYII